MFAIQPTILDLSADSLTMCLTFTTLYANSADNNLMVFPQKNGSGIYFMQIVLEDNMQDMSKSMFWKTKESFEYFKMSSTDICT